MTTTLAVKTLRQVEVECPPLVAAALPDDLFKSLRIENAPSILIKKIQVKVAAGFCLQGDLTEQGEVTIDSMYTGLERSVTNATARKHLVDIYLHEVTHRLTEGHNHDAVFATVNLALQLRARTYYPDLFESFSIYNFRDHFIQDATVDAAAAFSFIIKNSEALAESNLTAEKIAIEAARRWTQYEADVLAMPARQAAQIAAAHSMKERLDQAQAAKWQFLAVGLLVGTVIVKLLG